jgi:hypothetical protein
MLYGRPQRKAHKLNDAGCPGDPSESAYVLIPADFPRTRPGPAGAPNGGGERKSMARKTKAKGRKGKSRLGKDKRRKHRHWQVTIYYTDGEKFARVYIDRGKAARFAERQKKSPVVRTARVAEIN